MADANEVQEPQENLDAEAIQAEEAALKPAEEDEVREQVIAKYGLDPEANTALVDQLVKDQLEGHKALSIAIKQKINWRTKAQTVPPTKAPEAGVQPKPEEIAKTVESVLEKRELEDLDLSEELKKEVQSIAKLKGISIKKALASDYIVFLKEKAEKEEKSETASLGGKSRASSKKDYSTMTSSDFDMRTKEGKEDFAKWEDHMRKQLG
jgi:hypothetical protein